jgi:hypothetical protein
VAAGRVGEVHGHDRVGAQSHARVELWPVSAAVKTKQNKTKQKNARKAIMILERE